MLIKFYKKYYRSLLVFLLISIFTTSLISCNLKSSLIGDDSSNSSASNKFKANKILRNVLYYGDWSIWGAQDNFYPKDIPADKLTHLNFAFLDFDSNGSLQFTDKGAASESPVGLEGVTWGDANSGILASLQDLKAKNPNLKIGVSLGGWSKSGDFSKVASDEDSRNNFVKNVLEFIKYSNMDFVDIDWEYPGEKREPDTCDNQNDEGTVHGNSKDKSNYIKLLKDFRSALDTQGKDLGKTYELSVALPASISKIKSGIDVESLFKIVDFANIMTYDMRGAWDEISGHHSPLFTNPNDPYKNKGFSIDECVNYYLDEGAISEKIVIGAAYYTRGWENVTSEGTDSDNPGLFGDVSKVSQDSDQSKTSGASNEAPLKNGEGGRRGGVWSYRSLEKLKSEYPNLKEYWDDKAKAPYLYDKSSGAFFTYDNIKSIKEKCKYVKENNLGGVISWMASNDAPSNSGSPIRDELTTTIKEGLYGDETLQTYDNITYPINVTHEIKTSKEEWNNRSSYIISITNNEKLTASGVVLQSVESTAKSLKNLKLYIKSKNIKLTGGDWNAGTIVHEGDFTIVDFSSSSTNKLIKPGSTITFSLHCNSNITDTSDIEAIYITERISSSGTEFGKKVLYEKEKGSSEANKSNSSTDTNSSKNFNSSEEIDTSPAPSEASTNYDSSKIYTGGEVVTYNGSKYKCKWWTQGETPVKSEVWEKVVQ